MRFTTDEIARITGGTAHGPPTTIEGASQDSRAIGEGQLFVPLMAERDGHDFIDAALAAGAAAYLTQLPRTSGSAIVVDDTGAALDQLADAARQRIDGPVVGITGSVGKTTTKDLLASVLSRSMTTHASERSFNNEIGVPLTLLNTPDDAEAVVVEMGSRGIGHIEALCRIARPTIGVVTAVAEVHTGEFGSIENVALGKGELIESLPSDGLAVIDHDVDDMWNMSQRTAAAAITFGRHHASDVRISSVIVDDELRATVTLESRWGSFDVSPSTRGAHMAGNAAAAAAVGLWLGIEPEAVADGLAGASTSPWRMELHRTSTDALVINDTYNANPTSMKGALDSLAAIRADRRVAVIGYMAELGSGESAAHESIIEYATDLGIDVVVVGTAAYGVAPAGDPIGEVGVVDANTAILVKGSRSAGLESIAAALVER